MVLEKDDHDGKPVLVVDEVKLSRRVMQISHSWAIVAFLQKCAVSSLELLNKPPSKDVAIAYLDR